MVQAEVIALDGKKYADWTKAEEVHNRAERQFLEADKTYFAQLKVYTVTLEELTAIRNAVAHASTHSQNEFRKVVRLRLVTVPSSSISVGAFLATTSPTTSPPQTFLETYLEQMKFVAALIVPK